MVSIATNNATRRAPLTAIQRRLLSMATDCGLQSEACAQIGVYVRPLFGGAWQLVTSAEELREYDAPRGRRR